MADSKQSSPGNEDVNSSAINYIKSNSRVITGFITRYILNTTTVSDGELLKRESFGVKDNHKPHKTILLVGETGTGKSTLINAMVTYMLGVKCNNKIWCEIIETKGNQTESQTKAVTVYDVVSEVSPISLTIIDTPGFGSTEGIEEDSKIAGIVLELCRLDGVHEINAVCLVVTSVTTRLTDRQLYIFDAVLSLFGIDVEKNIVVLITHAASKPYNTIEAIKKSKIPCAKTENGEPVYYRFNNFHCQNFNDDEIFDEYKSAWVLLDKTMMEFHKFLSKSSTVSLKMTEIVLNERKQLTASIENLKFRIKLTELKKIELEQKKAALEQHEKKKKEMNNFECVVDEPYKEKVPIESEWWHLSKATCCSVCEENCHYPGCWLVRDRDLSLCSIMSKGKCTVCTRRCHYTEHVKEGKMYVLKTRKVKSTIKDLEKKYETEFKKKKSFISNLENEIKKHEEEKIMLVEECYHCVITLEKIALKSDSLSTLLHLDFLTEKVKETGKLLRVKKLQELKESARVRLQKFRRYLGSQVSQNSGSSVDEVLEL